MSENVQDIRASRKLHHKSNGKQESRIISCWRNLSGGKYPKKCLLWSLIITVTICYRIHATELQGPDNIFRKLWKKYFKVVTSTKNFWDCKYVVKEWKSTTSVIIFFIILVFFLIILVFFLWFLRKLARHYFSDMAKNPILLRAMFMYMLQIVCLYTVLGHWHPYYYVNIGQFNSINSPDISWQNNKFNKVKCIQNKSFVWHGRSGKMASASEVSPWIWSCRNQRSNTCWRQTPSGKRREGGKDQLARGLKGEWRGLWHGFWHLEKKLQQEKWRRNVNWM